MYKLQFVLSYLKRETVQIHSMSRI